MDHKEQHHEHHVKERERRKKEREERQGKSAWPIHPGWLLIVGIVATLAAVMIWTFFPR